MEAVGNTLKLMKIYWAFPTLQKPCNRNLQGVVLHSAQQTPKYAGPNVLGLVCFLKLNIQLLPKDVFIAS